MKLKSTANTGNGTTKDNSIKDPVESDNIARETTQGNSAINNKSTKTTDGDTPHIEIKDKNSKQNTANTDTQGELQI